MIAVVGHADVTPESLGLLEAELVALLEGEPDGEPGVVRAGGGAPWRSRGHCGWRDGTWSS